MAIQTLLPYDVNQRAAAQRATSDLAEGLGDFVQRKLQKMQQAEQAKGLQRAGYSDADIAILNMIPQGDIFKFLSSYQPQQQAPMQDMMMQALQPQMQGGMGTPQQGLNLGALQQGSPQDAIMRALGKTPLMQQQMPLQNFPQAAQPQVQQEGMGIPQQQPLTTAQRIAQTKFETPEMKQRREFHREKLTAAQQKDIDKETLPTYHEINKQAKAAKDSNIRLGRMEQLINKGNLSNTAFYNGIKALGKIPGIGGYIESVAESFLSPDTQEFEKLSTDFIKDAKQYFGNRITQQEVMMFLKTVPNLSQTNAGKRRVVRNMRIFNEASELRKKAMDNLIKANGGRRPANLEALIEEQVSPQLDALAEQFKTGG